MPEKITTKELPNSGYPDIIGESSFEEMDAISPKYIDGLIQRMNDRRKSTVRNIDDEESAKMDLLYPEFTREDVLYIPEAKAYFIEQLQIEKDSEELIQAWQKLLEAQEERVSSYKTNVDVSAMYYSMSQPDVGYRSGKDEFNPQLVKELALNTIEERRLGGYQSDRVQEKLDNMQKYRSGENHIAGVQESLSRRTKNIVTKNATFGEGAPLGLLKTNEEKRAWIEENKDILLQQVFIPNERSIEKNHITDFLKNFSALHKTMSTVFKDVEGGKKFIQDVYDEFITEWTRRIYSISLEIENQPNEYTSITRKPAEELRVQNDHAMYFISQLDFSDLRKKADDIREQWITEVMPVDEVEGLAEEFITGAMFSEKVAYMTVNKWAHLVYQLKKDSPQSKKLQEWFMKKYPTLKDIFQLEGQVSDKKTEKKYEKAKDSLQKMAKLDVAKNLELLPQLEDIYTQIDNWKKQNLPQKVETEVSMNTKFRETEDVLKEFDKWNKYFSPETLAYIEKLKEDFETWKKRNYGKKMSENIFNGKDESVNMHWLHWNNYAPLNKLNHLHKRFIIKNYDKIVEKIQQGQDGGTTFSGAYHLYDNGIRGGDSASNSEWAANFSFDKMLEIAQQNPDNLKKLDIYYLNDIRSDLKKRIEEKEKNKDQQTPIWKKIFEKIQQVSDIVNAEVERRRIEVYGGRPI